MQLIHSEAGLRIGLIHSLLVVVVGRSADNAMMQLINGHTERIAQSARLATLTVIARYDGPLKADMSVMKEGQARLDRLDPPLLGQGFLVAVKGLQGTMIHTIMTTIMLVTRRPLKVLGSTSDAVAWIRALPGQAAPMLAEMNLSHELDAFIATCD